MVFRARARRCRAGNHRTRVIQHRPVSERDDDRILRGLEQAFAARDPGAAETALDEAFGCGLSPAFVPVLVALLGSPWHQRHEDIVRALQELRDPRAVDSLYQAALAVHEYRDYDEFQGLARRCTWALADIGTAEAFSRLQALARSPDELVAGYARKRIDRWHAELGRKAGPPVYVPDAPDGASS
jgi:HEAT repeat protein